MRIVILENPEQVGRAAADVVIKAATRPGFRLGVATGSSPEPLYAELRAAHQRGDFTLQGATAWALDEYVGVPEDHPERYRNVLRRELVGPDATGLREESLFTPDGLADDPALAAHEHEQGLSQGVHLQILGIGSDGHIGFNEPSGSLFTPTRVNVLLEQTRQDNARFFNDDISQVPALCITQGTETIMRAEQIVLVATGSSKAKAVAGMIEGPVSVVCPASVLQQHRNVTAVVDEAAAAELQLTDYYRQVEAAGLEDPIWL